MGRTGICWDNALAESFFGALKNELIYRTVYPTREKARRAIAEYIEGSTIDSAFIRASATRLPLEVANEYQQQSALAA